MSFSLNSLRHEKINGSYKLQTQNCLSNLTPAILLTSQNIHQSLTTPSKNQNANLTNLQQNSVSDISTSSTEMAAAADNKPISLLLNTNLDTNRPVSLEDEDVISIDSASAAANAIDGQTGQVILSKKAIHQRDADENLFLRFLELDPPTDTLNNITAPGVSTSSAASTGANSIVTSNTINATSSARRTSTFPKSLSGRTPFTVTKRLTRTSERGFGFSIVWTHPPRVEKIEPGLSAAQSGILPGDYVIFVDKHNVVTMPEADILNLIRSQGNNLTLEIFRRQPSSGIPPLTSITSTRSTGLSGVLAATNSSVCDSTTMIERRKLLLLKQQKKNGQIPNQSIGPVTDLRKRFLLQLISREQNFVGAIQFGIQRFITPLQERKDLISPNDHRTLFQNIDELMRISEDILEQLVNENNEQDPQMNFTSRVYLSKTTAICAAYKKYCNGIKRADCVLVNKSRQPGSDFVSFITEPQVPRRRPDLTMLIHRPLQHFREILKLMQLLSSHCHVDSEEHKNFTSVINELQAAYREITVGGGLMEPLGEGRPLLTLQDLEARMVFTRCKPFTLAVQGRQWIFGGDLSRVEGRSIKPYWTLLFSDIIVFAKVSRDRVLFITEEPLPIANIVDSCFNIRKKNTEFRITVDPNGRSIESPTAYCAPDLTKTPKKNTRRKSLILRAPSLELKAVWQNLLQRQIFLVNAALGSTPLSSPLDSPDVLNTLVPLSDIGATNTSIASIKLTSMDSLNLKNQQQQQHRKINVAQHMETLIDEKCRILNKTGTSKASALHLANWMKGQLDKQQEQARLVAITQMQSNENLDKEDIFVSEEEEEEKITFWTKEQLEKRTKELNFAKENPGVKPVHRAFGGKRLSGVEEVAFSDVDSEVKSPSRSTTSDSQITVRSSPNPKIIDKLSVCRHCHKNCKQSLLKSSEAPSSPPLLSNSLKVQHSQASPNRCCKLNGLATISSSLVEDMSNDAFSPKDDIIRGSSISSESSTVTGDRSHHSNEILLNKSSEKLIKTSRSYPNSVASVPITTTQIINGNISRSVTEESMTSISRTSLLKSITETTTTESVSSTANILNSIKDTNVDQNTKMMQKVSNIPSKDKNQFGPTRKSPALGLSSLLMKSSACQKFINTSDKNYIPCNCKCTPEDFSNTTLSPDELKQETCKIIEDVAILSSQIPLKSSSDSPSNKNILTRDKDLHRHCKCICNKTAKEEFFKNKESDEDLSLVLIGLAQLNPAAKLLNSNDFVPTISVVPPTPENTLSKTCINIWDNQSSQSHTFQLDKNLNPKTIPIHPLIENINDTPDDSPLDEDPPYRPMSTGLRRFGTLSSLEKLPGDENLNAENTDDDDDVNDLEHDEEDIKVITKEIFDANHQQTTLRNWTSKAGSYVAGKMSFFEESRAFIDKYLGRWSAENDDNEEEQLEECTSGEEVWGTPTSGGDNDDLQMPNSDLTQSSPTKSSGSLNDDDDTELMMDELLMAPPMTASTIRGLLPRRRLEPLFEEETESDEEKTQLESEEIKKGETAANGHDLKSSSGSSSEEESEKAIATSVPVQQTFKKIEKKTIQEEKLTPITIQLRLKQMQIQKRNFLMMREAGLITSSPQQSTMTTKNIPMRETAISTTTEATKQSISMKEPLNSKIEQQPLNQKQSGITAPILTMTRVLKTSAITTTMSNEKSTISVGEVCLQTTAPMKNPKFSPPPPPPRRLLLTKSNQNLEETGVQTVNNRIQLPQKSGDTADIGSGAAIERPPTTHQIDHFLDRFVHTGQKGAYNTKDSVENIGLAENEILKSKAELVQVEKKSANTLKKEGTLTQQFRQQAEKISVETAKDDMDCAQNFSRLSPRLEMRLALNHDILGDEDLISYNPGPDLTRILGHDLSTYHRRTGKDLLNRATLNRSTTNRIQPKEAVISFCQQRNSKMDTPTVKRRQQQIQEQKSQTNQNIWNSSVFVDQIKNDVGNENKQRKYSNSSDGSKLSDLELLAKQEKMYCMSQLRSGSPAKSLQYEVKEKNISKLATTMMTTVLSSQATTVTTTTIRRNSFAMAVSDNSDSDSLIGSGNDRGIGRSSRLYNFLLRRNSENHLSKILSQNSLSESTGSSTPGRRLSSLLSPRKDNDKPSLNRRFWKQLTKRRRANSVSQFSEISTS
ncbi:uncharacterized protein LOC129619296 isoform X2 [Condylostylus longicornis]|uniref:uncharacterized protein LOC129619296 isoform X2 n=1 Tax=Condylostylus longicornis TaxID=2530218 RepID=UPI00244DD4F5|nr:uncharacterized protein LOC129619296 isoform X2 [Condylostylus longicornis]